MKRIVLNEGKLRRTDYVLDISTGKMVHPSNEDYRCLGSDIQMYYKVERVIK